MKSYYRISFFLILMIVFTSSCSLLNKSSEEKKEEHHVKTEEEFHYDAHFLEALRLKILGKTERAIMELEKARQYIDNEAPLYYQLAELCSQMGDYGLAQRHAEKAVELEEDNIWYHILLAQLYQNAGLFADASE
ncbi:MAG: tetratricopeptide repeat protein, partial [Bacteroidales bacterium]